MNIKRSLVTGALFAAMASPLVYRTYGKEKPTFIAILRNVAWNDLVAQIGSLQPEESEDSLKKDLQIIQTFLKEHERTVRVGTYDLKVFKAIDQARDRLKKADKDLEAIRNEMSYREERAMQGR
jgi:hypothetical protein